jgi:hypothetical protein
LPVGHLLSNQRSRPFWFTKLRLWPLFHSRELRAELRLPAAIPANRGPDTGTLQAYLGRRSIQSSVRYTELAPTRFKVPIKSAILFPIHLGYYPWCKPDFRSR